MLFGIIGHAVDPGYIDLSDRDDIVRDIRQLYRDAAPRIRYEQRSRLSP